MKKICIILTVCAVMVLVLGSCGASKKCPAYTQHNSEKPTNARS